MSRLKLHEELCEILGSRNVYFQPPESVKLTYPCIIYELSNVKSIRADDTSYTTHRQYLVKHIYKNAEGDLIDAILGRFSYCSFDRRFVSDNLYHDAYNLFY